jgi:hypothetical protein
MKVMYLLVCQLLAGREGPTLMEFSEQLIIFPASAVVQAEHIGTDLPCVCRVLTQSKLLFQGLDGTLPRCKPFKYIYEKEIVM